MDYLTMKPNNVMTCVTRAKWRDMTDEERDHWGQEYGLQIGQYEPNLWFIHTSHGLAAFNPVNPDPDSEEFFRWFRIVESA